jgi:hypothetical protein
MIKRLGVVAALAALVALLAACEPVADPNPQPDRRPEVKERVLTLVWYCNQPYKFRWSIEGGNGLNPKGEENSAGGEHQSPLKVGNTPLTITITVIMSNKSATGWVKIKEGEKELTFQPADRGTRQGTAVYHYKPS